MSLLSEENYGRADDFIEAISLPQAAKLFAINGNSNKANSTVVCFEAIFSCLVEATSVLFHDRARNVVLFIVSGVNVRSKLNDSRKMLNHKVINHDSLRLKVMSNDSWYNVMHEYALF